VCILDFYQVGARLGESTCGSGGEILHSKRISDGLEFAVKKIAKLGSWEGKSQVLILQRLHQKNIVEMLDWFEDSDHLFIVMELARGGDLFDKIAKVGRMSENQAANIFSQILMGVRHMHMKNVVHSDIKPENILCMSSDEDVPGIKIADFGFAQMADQGCQTRHQGTLTYSSPEIIDGQTYDTKADMWSLGVLLYSMLAGFAPFGQHESRSRQMSKIRQCQLNFNYQPFRSISADAIDLIRKLIVITPQQRLSATDALRHPWVVHNTKHAVDMDGLSCQMKSL
jgi:serine/threonine protein kinase